MYKWILSLFLIFSTTLTAFQAANPEHTANISTRVIVQNGEGYFVLSDGSCWKAVAFCKRWRSLTEWWNSVELVPKNYECAPNDWCLNSEIEAYAKYDHLEVDEANASNADVLKQCTHLLFNRKTGQILFGMALHPGDCIVRVYAEGKREGADEGYRSGYEEGYKSGKGVGHFQGSSQTVSEYRRGFTDGYGRGRSDEKQNIAARLDDAYFSGYNSGFLDSDQPGGKH